MSLANDRRDGGVRRLFVTAVVLPLAIAVMAGAWFAWQIERIADAADWIDSSDQVIALVIHTQKTIVDQEMGLRAFVFTDDPAFLEPYLRAGPDDDLDELEHLLAADPVQAALAHALREKVDAWKQRADETIARPARSRGVAAMRARRRDVDELLAMGTDIVTREKSTRLSRTRGFERQTRSATLGAVSLILSLALASSVTSYRKLRLIGAMMQRERDALRTARDALRAKDTFLANLSHELRTPLTPLLGWVGLLRRGRLHGEAMERAFATIERNAKAEQQIVDDLLDISHITAGKLRIAQEQVDVAGVARAALSVVAPSARAKGIALEADIAPSLPALVGDPVRLQQVVWNLLSNAVKFTPRGGRVSIQVDHPDESVRVRVTDDGEGIPAEFLPHVFEHFRQADASMTRAHGGLGLGLAIVERLVELHGGEVTAASDGPGRGATFTITLPVTAPA